MVMRAPGQVDDHDESNCIECCEESLKPGNAAVEQFLDPHREVFRQTLVPQLTS
jgi:hypothetical protein